MILLWIGWYSTQPINTHTHQKVQEIHSSMHAFSFCPIHAHLLRITLSSSLPFVTHIRGHMWHALLSLPHYRVCLRFNREKKKSSELSFLPWCPLASNWCAFMQPTSIIRSTQAARRFLRSVRILMLLFQVLISTRTNTYEVRHFFL